MERLPYCGRCPLGLVARWRRERVGRGSSGDNRSSAWRTRGRTSCVCGPPCQPWSRSGSRAPRGRPLRRGPRGHHGGRHRGKTWVRRRFRITSDRATTRHLRVSRGGPPGGRRRNARLSSRAQPCVSRTPLHRSPLRGARRQRLPRARARGGDLGPHRAPDRRSRAGGPGR